MTVPSYGAECPHCAQVRHVADGIEAWEALSAHLAQQSRYRCAYWPDLHWRRLNARRNRRRQLRRSTP